MIRVLVATSLTSRRKDVRSLLARLKEIRVVGGSDYDIEALRLIQRHQPDVVLIDIPVPMMNGLATAMRAKALFPDLHVVITLMHVNAEHVLRALKIGAEGYLDFDADKSEFGDAILRVGRGSTYLCSSVSRVLVSYVHRTARELLPLDALTVRQREVLQLIADGNSTKGIARILGVSVKTVETHRFRLMTGLNLHSIAELVRYAILSGVAGD